VKPIHGLSTKGTPMTQRNGSMIYEEEFSSSNSDWYQYAFDDEISAGSLAILDGTYQIELIAKVPCYYFSNDEIIGLPGNYLVSVDAKWLEGEGVGSFGLQTNYIDESNFDFMLLSTEGDLMVGALRNSKMMLFYDTKSTPNKTVPVYDGEINTLSVLVESEDTTKPTVFSYAINGYTFFTLEYEQTQEFLPNVGVIVSLDAEGDSATVRFDNLIITAQ
jgi:hypothetical protein